MDIPTETSSADFPDDTSDFSLESFELDDSYMFSDQPISLQEQPNWLQQRLAYAYETGITGATVESSSETPALGIYRDLAILDAGVDTNPWIRLLRIEAGDTDQPIRCTLLRQRLWEDKEYFALSYSWGQKVASETIYLNREQLPFAVSEHLWNALHKLRSAHGQTTLWVDAICIDQQNFLERTAQVAIMAQIFNGASRVMIWLGDCVSGPNQVTPSQVTVIKQFLELCNQSSPWWTRLWVVQECVYAQTCPVVMLGDFTWSMEGFIDHLGHEIALESLSKTTEADSARVQQLEANFELLRMPFDAWREGTQGNRHLLPLLDRVQQTSKRQCKDPRDRIYALLGLIDEAEARLIQPDYQKPYSELLFQVAESLNLYPYSATGRDSAWHELFEEQGNRVATGSTPDELAHKQAKPIPSMVKGRHFYRVVMNQDLELVTKLLAAGADQFVQSNPLLLLTAVEKENLELVNKLLEAGANPNARSYQWNTQGPPLLRFTVVEKKNLELTKVLLEAGADPNVRCEQGYPLLWSVVVEMQNLALAEMLLEAGADPNSRYYPEPLLRFAVIQKETQELVKLLLEHHAEVPENIVRVALEHGKMNIAWQLLCARLKRVMRIARPS